MRVHHAHLHGRFKTLRAACKGTRARHIETELRGFGESSVDFAVEYWVNGIDDGKNKYMSQVLFAVWRALKDADIEMPYPHRVVEMRTPRSKAT